MLLKYVNVVTLSPTINPALNSQFLLHNLLTSHS